MKDQVLIPLAYIQPELGERIVYFLSVITFPLIIFGLFKLLYSNNQREKSIALRKKEHLPPWFTADWAITGWLSYLLIVVAALFFVFGIRAVRDIGIYNVHFNAIFEPMVQVFLGRQLLVNLVAQYGLFPHFLEPLFRLVGLSVLSFTVVLGSIMAISLLAVYLFVIDIVANRNIGRLGFIATFYWSYLFIRTFSHTHDYVFQYFPIRFVFPALSIYFVWQYIKTNRSKYYVSCHVLAALSLLWNIDVGVVVFGTWLSLLLYRTIFDRNIIAMVKHIACGILSVLVTFSVYAIFARLRSGLYPDFSLLMYFQNIYGNWGFGMLPINPFHPWHFLIITYMIGLVIGILSLLKSERQKNIEMIFYLSLTGLGLFVYYLGRSHILNLFPISYPAIILITLFADQLSSSKEFRHITRAIILFLILSAFFTIISVPFTLRIIYARSRLSLGEGSSSIMSNIALLRTNFSPDKEPLILSQLSGLYYLAAKTKSPLDVPSPQELLLKKDQNKIFNFLIQNPREKRIFLDDNYFDNQTVMMVRQNYRAISKAKGGTLTLYEY
ncbi:MAG: hypothetical protein ABIE84_01905 [bacterium]